MNLIRITNLSKSYYSINEETKAIDEISFDINNEFTGIIGPSGCGKSSILNIISKQDNDYNGKIIKSNNLKIGYMLQEDALFPWLTIYENAILGLKVSKSLNEENIKYVLHLLKKYNLFEFKDKYPSELSGGMKQRVALIRTLAIKPDLLLLDEPFSALDYQTRLSVCDDVYKIIKEENKAVVIVTHDVSEAISFCDKVIVLTKRPAKIKNIYHINHNKEDIPTKNRKKEDFQYYFDLIWSDIEKWHIKNIFQK